MTDERTHAAGGSPETSRTVAGRYALLAELGRGGMGVVWRAEDTVIGRQVAIKELRLGNGREDVAVFQERVLREVRTGGRLNDPAVVTVYDVVTEGDATFIVMELVEAPTLADLINRNGPMPAQQAAGIGEQVLSALQTAHAAGIVHRDVKPGNIMVGANGRVKLTDFGIAQAIDDPRLTTSGMIVGSPAFMAPERIAGHDALAASDLWSLGITLFYVVEGSLPFERSTTAATLHAIMNEVPYLTRVQGPLASAITSMLIPSPEARISGEQAKALLDMATKAPAPPPPVPATQPYGGHRPPHGGGPAQRPVTGQYGPPTPPGGHGHPGAAHGAGGLPPTSRGPVLSGPNPAPRKGKGAMVATVLGVVAALGLATGAFFFGKSMTTDEQGAPQAMLPTMTYGQGGDIPELDYRATSYYCLNTPLTAKQPVAETNWTDCGSQHHVEFFNSATALGVDSEDMAAEVAEYPGPATLTAFAEANCAIEFESNSIPDDRKPGLRYRALIPTKQEWEREPDPDLGENAQRSVYCVLSSADGSMMVGALDRTLR
ncbi:serine/threonine-protein kinase [Saccharomonospora sp. NPDC006951]